MTTAIRLDLPLVLPGITDERDACIERLIPMLEAHPGCETVHVLRAGDAPSADSVHRGPLASVADGCALCLHYDPERLTLREITDIASTAGAALLQRYAHPVIAINAIGSEDAALRLEDGLKQLRGVTAASASLAGQLIRVEYDTTIVSRSDIDARLRELKALPTDRLPAPPPTDGPESWYGRNRELAWSLASGVCLLLGVIAQYATSSAQLPVVAFAVAYIFGGRDNIGHFLTDVRRGRFRFDIDLLMVVAAAGAAALGQWREGALLLFLFSLGHALEHYALGRARNAITALADLAPQEASVLRDGVATMVPIADVRKGDRVVIKPGQRVAVDGAVREGTSAVNQSPITGESMPVLKAIGDAVFAGSVNGDGALVVEVTAATGDRTLDRVIKLVAEAQTMKAPTQQFTDRFEAIFVPLVLGADLLLMVVPPMLGVLSWHDAIYRALTVLVASSPCALALGTPSAVLAGIAQAARNGVLIKGGAYLESLGAIRTLAFDKTGTITRGEPEVTDVLATAVSSESELVSAAAGVEARSQHPLARAIMAEAARRNVAVVESADTLAVSGKGVKGHVADALVEAGRALYFETDTRAPAPPLPADIRQMVSGVENAGRTAVIVRHTSTSADIVPRWLGVLGIADAPRSNARRAIEQLRAIGIQRILMLTGDNTSVANAVAKDVGITEVRAALLPEDKLTIIRDLVRSSTVAMVGDGVNDAPALAHATVGIAMGGAGTAVALETADVALMGDDLERLAFAIGLSRKARGIIRQNLAVSLGVIAVLVSGAVAGRIGIGIAVLFHEGSTLLVVANSLRLLAHRAPGASGADATDGSSRRSSP